MLPQEAARIRALLEAATRAAGQVALAAFRHGAATTATIDYKDGGSPVTAADHAANAVLIRHLRDAEPGFGWLSEETADTAERLGRRSVFIVDPIDGTRGFMIGDPRWTVCAALVQDGRPVAGAVFAPALDLMLSAVAGGGAAANGAVLKVLEGRPPLRAGGPKPFLDRMEPVLGPLDRRPRIPSLAFRLASVALGDLDLACAGGNARDWDIAAADIILAEAGAGLTDLGGQMPVYNRRDPVHPALIAGAERVRGRVLAAVPQ